MNQTFQNSAQVISILFAAFLGYNSIQHLGSAGALAAVSAHNHAVLTGQACFPHLISQPFADGLDTAFAFAVVACLVAAAASLMRGGRYEYAGEGERRREGPAIQPKLEEQHAR